MTKQFDITVSDAFFRPSSSAARHPVDGEGPKKSCSFLVSGWRQGRLEAGDDRVVRPATVLIGPPHVVAACCWNKISCSLRKKRGSRIAVRLLTPRMTEKRRSGAGLAVLTFFLLVLAAMNDAQSSPQVQNRIRVRRVPSSRAELNLEEIPFKILCESYRRTDGKENWELLQINADGSSLINLTNTPDLDEMYAHASPDGTKICFVADEGLGRRRLRNVYYMNIDGTERVKIARNARQPCWSPDGKTIAYLKGEYERYSTREYATSELFFYDLQTRQHKPHVNKTLHHIYAINWSPDGDWFLGAVHGGMGYSDTILAFEVNGMRVFDLARWGVKGCRPDVSFDGTMMTWGETDWDLCLADLDLTGRSPELRNVRKVVGCRRTEKVYHVDLSPDKKYIVFSYGPWAGGQQVGGKAKGWNLCISDLTGKWVRITTDGLHYKEPDWVPIR